MLVGREEELYTHLRGAFIVARFDILGNAKALTRGTGRGLTPRFSFVCINTLNRIINWSFLWSRIDRL